MFHNKINKKIKDIKFLTKFRKNNLNKKIIICHGVFDIVHPGHVRHLMYAKSKADILIASITSDVHIDKGVYRPHVPENLRALNLAAFEIVDFVIIDKNPEPYEILKKIKPNYFAKGYDYIGSENKKTQKEIKILKSYGGEIIFTPGDYVNSSSKLINNFPPNLKYEKLITVLNKYNLDINKIRKAVINLKNIEIDIVGDMIIDSYTNTKTIGGQTKSPTLSVLFEKKIDHVGGAGVVAKHVAASGNKANLITVLGNDELKKFAINDLKKSKVNYNGFTDKLRPTINKNAIVADNYRLIKISKLDNSPIKDEISSGICNKLSKSKADGVIFSDFRGGIFNKKLINKYKKSLKKNVFTAADSQVASWWGNILEFKGFDLITPNEKEARFALVDQVSGIRYLASTIYNMSKCKTLILKLGKRGVLTCVNNKHSSSSSYFTLDSFTNNAVDPVGAGDALLAYSTLSMISNKSKLISSLIGVLAASCECEKDGNIPISKNDILQKIDEIEKNL